MSSNVPSTPEQPNAQKALHDARMPPNIDAPSQRSRRILVSALVVLVAASLSLTAVLRQSRLGATATERTTRLARLAEGRPVLVAKVAKTQATRHVTLPGDIKPWRGATIYSKVSGYLKEIRVDKGDTVRQGQILGIVESPETDQQVASSQADLAVKKRMEERYRALVEGGVVSRQEMDNATAAVRSGEADLRRLKALEQYEEIRAPFDGMVTARYADPGALLPAATGGTESLQPLVEVQDMNRVRIMVYVGQSESSYVKDGDIVQVTSKDLPTLNMNVPISRTAHALDMRTRTMLVEIDVDNHERILAPGLFVSVHLHIAEPTSLVVPSDAVFLRDGQTWVAVIDDSIARYTKVTTGADDGHTVRILEGLKLDQSIGLHIADDVSDGAKVKPIFKATGSP